MTRLGSSLLVSSLLANHLVNCFFCFEGLLLDFLLQPAGKLPIFTSLFKRTTELLIELYNLLLMVPVDGIYHRLDLVPLLLNLLRLVGRVGKLLLQSTHRLRQTSCGLIGFGELLLHY